MLESRKLVLRQTGIVLLGQAVCLGMMFGIYGLLSRLTVKVLLSGLVGGLVATGNFFFMAMIVTLAADKAEAQDVSGGQKLMKSSYPIRLLVLTVLMVLLAVSGWFDILPLALPLLFVRPTITVAEFFRKKGE